MGFPSFLPVSQDRPDPEAYRSLIAHIGKYGRRILLLAPSYTDPAAIIRPERSEQHIRDAHNTAIRTLEREGLVSIEWMDVWVELSRTREEWEWNQVLGEWVKRRVPIRQRRRQRALKLTPLGAEVVRQMRSETGEC
jgi:hypothetical protein